VTAGIVVLVSEAAKHSDRLGAFIVALPTAHWLTKNHTTQGSLPHLKSHYLSR